MDYKIEEVSENEKGDLAEIRVAAMQESLEAIGRFDPERARTRFMENFSKADTKKILIDDQLIGFYVLKEKEDHLWLDHLYIHPQFQGGGIGGKIVDLVKSIAKAKKLPIRLGALRDSKSNDFYQKQGFTKTHEEEWDIYYVFQS